MSDYLGNLVTRTLSHAAAVRPQLPSLFEPTLASGQIKSELEFEQETFSESSPMTQRTEAAAPISPSLLTPRQSSLGELELAPIAHRSETPPSSAPSIPMPLQSSLGEPEPPPITHRSETPTSNPPSILAVSQPAAGEPQPTLITRRTKTPASILVPSQSVLREPEPKASRSSRPKGIRRATEEPEPSPEDVVPRSASKWPESRSNPGRAETNVAPVAPELRKNDVRAGQLESGSRRARSNEVPTSISQLSTPDSQPKSPSLVRPAVTAQRIRAVEAVVPAVRTSPQFPSTPTPAPAPTINVTIGRVEIRATSPAPAPPRVRPKPANVLSLEDYLRQRAKGGGR